VTEHEYIIEPSEPRYLRDERRHSFFIIDNGVLTKAPQIGVHGLAVYCVLACMADANRTCFPSRRTIATKLGISTKSVDRYMAALIEHGLVGVERRTDPETGNPISSVYRLLPVDSETRGRDSQSPPQGLTDATLGTVSPPNKTQGTRPNEQEGVVPNGTHTARGGDPKGTRLPVDWEPRPEDIAFGIQRGFSASDLAELTAEFRDYWNGVPGARGRKVDWDGTFRNRIRDSAVKRTTAPKEKTNVVRNYWADQLAAEDEQGDVIEGAFR